MAWRIEYEGEVYREDDLTLNEQESIAELLGRAWAPHPVTSAKAFRAVLATCIATRQGSQVDEVILKLGSIRTADVLSMVSDEDEDTPTEYVDGNPPLAAEPSTGI